MNVSIIIPSYNTVNLLAKNLPRVIEVANNKKNNILEIILVDDASPDNSVDYVKKNLPEIKVIRHKVNRGFSSSVNTGVRAAKGDLVCLLNTDVIPYADFMVKPLDLFEDKQVFGISFNEGKFAWAKADFVDGYIVHAPGEQTETTHQTFYISGGSGVFRRSTWVELGGMDEKLLSPFYWEDLDLSYRALKRGYLLYWEPKAKVSHEHEGTIGKLPQKRVQRIRERNQLLFNWKNLSSQNLFRKHLLGLFSRIVKHPGYLIIFLMALGRLSQALKERKKEIKESKISDEAILTRFK